MSFSAPTRCLCSSSSTFDMPELAHNICALDSLKLAKSKDPENVSRIIEGGAPIGYTTDDHTFDKRATDVLQSMPYKKLSSRSLKT